ncbi:hypothetical protein [Hominisplanchenecus sp.]|uniref:hypothetical protein n=1 Tax=Hominisplanchenecus sp. TaxID=3038130 RepID=UPI003992646D
MLDEEPVGFFSEFPVTGEIPCELQRLADGERFEGNCGMVLSLNEEKNPFAVTLHLIPRIVSLGIGCKRYTAGDGRAGSFKSTAKLSCVDTQHFCGSQH